MIKTLTKIGDSLGLMFDAALVELTQLKAGDQVRIAVNEGGWLKPILLHSSEEVRGKWKTCCAADDRVDAALRTQSGLANVGNDIAPLSNTGRRKYRNTVEAATLLTTKNLVAVADRMPMSFGNLRIVYPAHMQRFSGIAERPNMSDGGDKTINQVDYEPRKT